MVKQAFMKTVEILLVIVITSIFMFVIASKEQTRAEPEIGSVLAHLIDNSEFRNFVSENTGCFNSSFNPMIAGYMKRNMDYMLCIQAVPENLPLKEVNVESQFLVGNYTNIEYKIIRLYKWYK